jgi:hypothetical protein
MLIENDTIHLAAVQNLNWNGAASISEHDTLSNWRFNHLDYITSPVDIVSRISR